MTKSKKMTVEALARFVSDNEFRSDYQLNRMLCLL